VVYSFWVSFNEEMKDALSYSYSIL